MKRFLSNSCLLERSLSNPFVSKVYSPLTARSGAGLALSVGLGLFCLGLATQPVFAQSKISPSTLPAQGATPSTAPSVAAPPPVPALSPATQGPSASPAPLPEALAVRVLLMPDVETVLVAQMVGRITALNASLGSRVTAGQVVVSLDCSESTAKLKMSEAELASARDSYDNKLRLKGLDAAGDVEVSLAASQVDRAKGQIEMTTAQIQACTVLAPFSGSVSKLYVKPHQGVNLGQQLFEMVSDGAPRLRLNVPSKWMRALKTGTGFNIAIEETGKSYRANVSAINTRVDPVAQTIEIEGRVVGKAPGLLPGMSGLARFSGMPAL
jgi:membrane fusion protein, multidrug efflux system